MRLTRRHIALAGSGLVLLLAVLFGFGPLVRAVASSKAQARGFDLSIGGARPGWFSVVLSDVVLQPVGAPALEVRLERVSVTLSALLAPRSVDVSGGAITVTGSPQLVADQLEAWRARFAPTRTGGSGGQSGLALELTDLELAWSQLTEKEGTFAV